MAFSPHVRIVWGGGVYDAWAAGNKVEDWSCSMSAIRAGGGLAMASLQDAVATRLAAFHARAASGISASVNLEYVKVNEVDATGHQITDPTQVTHYTGDHRGAGSGSVLYPLQTAIKVTLDDGTRNRRARGGFYLPRPNMPLGIGGQFLAADMDALLGSVKTLVDGISSEAGITVAIASKVDASMTPVTRVRVGTVPDTIRRRRNSLVEQYRTGVIVP